MDTARMEIINDSKGLPQCHYFVVRKKRLCRMTVRPGRDYCGEHEPQPRTENGKDDTRIPCPYDPKHTCYASKLLRHLAICNARQAAAPAYIVRDINAPPPAQAAPRQLLGQIPQHKILALIHKVNILYDKYVKGTISEIAERPIHDAVKAEFCEEGRTESSLRHLRQASSLLHVLEEERLVRDGTCYVELGAGKGHLSYYAYTAWCGNNASRVLLVDRASLRHKRDNKLRDPRASAGAAPANDASTGGASGSCRIRADLAHLALEKVPDVAQCDGVVGFAKHLCGVATDYALRCVTGAGVARRVRGLVLATCCHHRCEPAAYVAAGHLQEMGITSEDLNIMLGVVSWATCGDGRSRQRRLDDCRKGRGQEGDAKRFKKGGDDESGEQQENLEGCEGDDKSAEQRDFERHRGDDESGERDMEGCGGAKGVTEAVTNARAPMVGREAREQAGRRAKALLDHARVRFLRERGYSARLCHYVSPAVSLENMCIVATKD